MAAPDDDLPVLEFANADAFDAWLREHHADAPGIWMRIAKGKAAGTTVTWKQAVPVALSWGWIDSQVRSLDATYFVQRWTPRRPRSVWSRINVEHCERLIAEGRMRPAGMAQVEAARVDGRWEVAYGGGATMQVPPELQAELDAHPGAAEAFALLKASERYSFCWRVHTAKRADTKQRRARQFVEQLLAAAAD